MIHAPADTMTAKPTEHDGTQCAICRGDSRVLRTAKNRRRRECERCGHRWPTREVSEAELTRLRAIEATAASLRELLPGG